ncbi:MAG: DegQ family serine endoprotease [Acidobacteriaceae bacterium]|jgi:Do/DeqQ family serine protease|nr:DegQ family serine endoprotease [Acidobacteriaceae bacterium]
MSNVYRALSAGRARIGAVVAAVGIVAGGATWHGFAADSASVAAADAKAPSVIARSAIAGRDSYADVVKVVAPAVVTIRVETEARVRPTQFGGNGDDPQDFMRRFFGQQGMPNQQQAPRSFRQRGLGSGVIISGDGYILTNNHVVDSADDVRVELTDGRSLKAKIVGADKPSDLALIKVEATSLPTLTLGNSDAVQIGDVVLAVGNPLGIGQTVTMGIISAKGRSTSVGDGSYEDFLQTDAPINHGNSGGALVNMKGELVGINSQIVSESDGNIGIGFAIPANMARHVMTDLKTSGRVHRSQLGVTVQPVTSDMAESMGLKEVRGAIVSAVADGSAAEKAGLKRGDVIVSFDGQPVKDFNSLRNRVADITPGSAATVGIIRDGSETSLNVKLDEADASKNARGGDDTAKDDRASLGVAVTPLTPEMAAQAGAPRDLKGLLVQQVTPDGRAADAGIQAGDVIVEVNRQPVQTADGLRGAIRAASDKPMLLLVNRKGQSLFLTARAS